jgi:erythromycin esterase
MIFRAFALLLVCGAASAQVPPAVGVWLKANAIPLDDLAPFATRLNSARIVAMGEATHGTREFQQFKVRMCGFLAEKLGFTVFAIEANWDQSLAANRYVLEGEGTAESALAMQVHAWKTVEVRDLLQWMRRYNQDPAHGRKLMFLGFDMMDPGPPETAVSDYLRKVDAASAKEVAQAFEFLGNYGENPAYEHAPAEAKQRTRETLTALLARFDSQEEAYIHRSSLAEWTMARQNMRLVQQAEEKIADSGEGGLAARDRAMAENARWILDREPAGTKMMVWAHNAHIASDGSQHAPMGEHLRRMYGAEFVNLGFVFGKGSFRALDLANNRETEFTLKDPPAGTIDAAMAGVGLPRFAADLRDLPAGPAADWFGGDRRSRQIGTAYSTATPGVWIKPMRPAKAFDFLLYIGEITPTVALPSY